MRKILLLSDTHGFLDEKIIKYANTVDEIWHAGDVGNVTIIDRLKQIKPLRGVYGNIDNHEIRKELPLDCKFYCENIYVWITHIGGYPNRYNERIKDGFKSNKVNLFICGHSHILKVINDKKKLSAFSWCGRTPGPGPAPARPFSRRSRPPSAAARRA